MRLYAFHCGGDRTDRAFYDPLDPDVGTKIYAPYFLYLVQHERGNVLFDSGIHPAIRTDPASRLGAAADSITVELRPDDHVAGQLAKVGLRPTDVETVVQSHLHFDHAGGLEFLTHATVLVQRAELPFAYWPPIYQREYYLRADFDHDLCWKELDGDHDVFGDGSIVVLATPGHTPGHQSLLVRLPGRPVVLMSDATYLMEKMRERRLPSCLWNPDEVVRSWERLEELERTESALLVCTHDTHFRERVPLAPDAWFE